MLATISLSGFMVHQMWNNLESAQYMTELLYDIIIKSKVSNLSRGWPHGSLFNSYHTEV